MKRQLTMNWVSMRVTCWEWSENDENEEAEAGRMDGIMDVMLWIKQKLTVSSQELLWRGKRRKEKQK